VGRMDFEVKFSIIDMSSKMMKWLVGEAYIQCGGIRGDCFHMEGVAMATP